MDRIAMLLLACVGAACIYAGYKLFCDLPAMNGDRPHPNVVLLNVVPGILLALLGVGLLAAEARSITTRNPVIRHNQPGAEGASWHLGKSSRPSRSA